MKDDLICIFRLKGSVWNSMKEFKKMTFADSLPLNERAAASAQF
jgi:hypothetical protein